MPGIQGTFDARAVEPKQGGGGHPVGNGFPFTVTDTTIEPAKDGKSGMLTIEFTSPAGSLEKRYSLWHENQTTVRIANEQLSALCHAVGVFQIQFDNDCAALRGSTGKMDVGFQKGQEPTVEKPAGGYVEIKKIYDRNGNEPGKAPAQTQQGFGGQQPPSPAPQQTTQNQPNSPVQPAWGGGQPAQQNGAGGWTQQQPSGAAPATPPWGGSR